MHVAAQQLLRSWVRMTRESHSFPVSCLMSILATQNSQVILFSAGLILGKATAVVKTSTLNAFLFIYPMHWFPSMASPEGPAVSHLACNRWACERWPSSSSRVQVQVRAKAALFAKKKCVLAAAQTGRKSRWSCWRASVHVGRPSSERARRSVGPLVETWQSLARKHLRRWNASFHSFAFGAIPSPLPFAFCAWSQREPICMGFLSLVQ